MIVFNPAPLFNTLPHAKTVCQLAFKHANADLEPFDILKNSRRLAHFLAQCLHETAGFSILTENLNYSAYGLVKTWPARFPSTTDAEPYVRNPSALAEKVYGGRMGNTRPGDGWKYIGRGFLQITGYDNYRAVGAELSLDLVGNPELAIDPEHALRVAGAVWKLANANTAADLNSPQLVTKRINGGSHGLLSRIKWLEEVRKIYGWMEGLEA